MAKQLLQKKLNGHLLAPGTLVNSGSMGKQLGTHPPKFMGFFCKQFSLLQTLNQTIWQIATNTGKCRGGELGRG